MKIKKLAAFLMSTWCLNHFHMRVQVCMSTIIMCVSTKEISLEALLSIFRLSVERKTYFHINEFPPGMWIWSASSFLPDEIKLNIKCWNSTTSFRSAAVSLTRMFLLKWSFTVMTTRLWLLGSSIWKYCHLHVIQLVIIIGHYLERVSKEVWM